MATVEEMGDALLTEWHTYCQENDLPWNPDGENGAAPVTMGGMVVGYNIYWDQWLKPEEYQMYLREVVYFLECWLGPLYSHLQIAIVTRS